MIFGCPFRPRLPEALEFSLIDEVIILRHNRRCYRAPSRRSEKQPPLARAKVSYTVGAGAGKTKAGEVLPEFSKSDCLPAEPREELPNSDDSKAVEKIAV